MKEKTKGYLFVLIGVLLWSTIEVVSKLLQGRVTALNIGFLRFFLGSVLLLPFAIWRVKQKAIKLNLKDYLIFAGLGAVGITTTYSFFHLSIELTKASSAAIIFSSNPIFVSIFAVLLLKEKINSRKTTGIVIGFIAMFILLFEKGTINFSSTLGVFLMIIATITFALYIVLMKKYIKKYTALVLTSFTLFFGSLFFIPAIMIKDGFSGFIFPLSALPWLMYLGFIPVGIGYLSYFKGVGKVDVSSAAPIYYVKPITAAILAVILLKEVLLIYTYLSIAIVIISLYLIISKGSDT